MKKRLLLAVAALLVLSGCEVPVKTVTNLISKPGLTAQQFEEHEFKDIVRLTWTVPTGQPAGTTYVVTAHSTDPDCEEESKEVARTTSNAASFRMTVGGECSWWGHGEEKYANFSVKSVAPYPGTSTAETTRQAKCYYRQEHYQYSGYTLQCGEFKLFDADTDGTAIDAGANSEVSLYWEADKGYTGGSVVSRSFSGLDPVLHTSRWGFTRYRLYTSPTDQQSVAITMVEPTFSAPGQRVFDLAVNGVVVGRDIDIFAKVGKGKPYTIYATVPNPFGTIDIVPTKKVDNPIVATISVSCC